MKKRSIGKKILCVLLALGVLLSGAVSAFAEEEKPIWADDSYRETSFAGVVTYRSENGEYSVEVKDGVTWLFMEKDNTRMWIGLDNEEGTFQTGDRFFARWLTANGDSEEFYSYWGKMDTEIQTRVRERDVALLLLGVQDPEGKDYTDLPFGTSVYLELGDAVDREEIQSVMTVDGKVEAFFVTMESPEGERPFAEIKLRHFGGGLFFEWENPFLASVFTKHQPLVIAVVVLVAAAAGTVLVLNRKKKKE